MKRIVIERVSLYTRSSPLLALVFYLIIRMKSPLQKSTNSLHQTPKDSTPYKAEMATNEIKSIYIR